MSKLLEHFDCLPRTPDEQKELICLLDEMDADASGTLDFEEFNHLILKIREKQLC